MAKSPKDGDESPGVGDATSRGLGIRHVQVAVMSMAAFLAYSLQTTLSVAIVAMVENESRNDTNTTIVPLAPTYDWSEETQGLVLSAFFWGYVLTQIPAGILTDRFGGHRILCGAIVGSSLFSLSLPQCAYLGGWKLVCACRMLQGICQGFVLPSIFTLLGVWAPPLERSTLASLSTGAQLLGTVASTPLSGFLCSAYGWPSAFYILGGFGAVTSTAMIFLGADYPSTHRMISNEEKNYIQASLGGAKQKLSVPWGRVLTSIPFWAASIAMTFEAWVFILLLTKYPTYLGTVLKFSLSDIGVYSALPFLVAWVVTILFSWCCDLLISQEWLSLTGARKFFNSIAHFGGAACISLAALTDNTTLSVVLLTAFMGTQAGCFVGVQAGFIDLAPNFAGAIYGVANFVCVSVCISGPIIAGHIVTETGSAAQWGIVFHISAVILIVSNIVYLVWGTAETQWWNWSDKYKDEHDYHVKIPDRETRASRQGASVLSLVAI